MELRKAHLRVDLFPGRLELRPTAAKLLAPLRESLLTTAELRLGVAELPHFGQQLRFQRVQFSLLLQESRVHVRQLSQLCVLLTQPRSDANQLLVFRSQRGAQLCRFSISSVVDIVFQFHVQVVHQTQRYKQRQGRTQY